MSSGGFDDVAIPQPIEGQQADQAAALKNESGVVSNTALSVAQAEIKARQETIASSQNLTLGLQGGLSAKPTDSTYTLGPTTTVPGSIGRKAAEVEGKFDPLDFSNAKYEHQDSPFAGQATQDPANSRRPYFTTHNAVGNLVDDARQAEKDGKLDEARDKYAEAVKADPGNAAAQHGLDEVLALQGRDSANGSPAALKHEADELNIRRQEINYRAQTAIRDATKAIKEGKWDIAETNIQRAELAAGADRAIFSPEDLRKFDDEDKQTRILLEQEQERVKYDASSTRQRTVVLQVEEERKRAALERQQTIENLERTRDDLNNQGKTKEAADVAAQIAILAAPAPEPAPAPKPDPAAPAAPPVAKPPAAVPRVEVPAIIKPKIIRTGEMEFEVESFQSAADTVKKIVEEEGGYVSTTDSDKLPNGKVKGSIVLRVTPERLDTLVLKLRGIGDLKTQNIRAQDITKQYTDMESRLRAAQAMYDQILDIIKSGKAAVKDLLEAEKQLGVWREKVEQLQGEINYYANQVALSTLTLTLFEKDIRTPAVASETETVTMTVVTAKVEDAAAKVKEAVVGAKGRIVASQIEQHDAGEFLATITAQVPPDAADAVIARLRQIDGQVNHFDRQRSQTTSNGNSPVDARSIDPVKIKREDVTINLTLFNLAKLTPRRNTNMSIAATSVDDAKTALETQVRAAGGRIIDARTEYPRPDQKKGTVSFDVPSEKADALIASLKSLGETLQISTIENPNSQGITESKRGFMVTIVDMAGVSPRRVTMFSEH